MTITHTTAGQFIYCQIHGQQPGNFCQFCVQAAKPQGCICPPTSEQTCQSPMCPRKNHTAIGANYD